METVWCNTTEQSRNSHLGVVVVSAVSLLILAAVLGPLLPGIQAFDGNIFLFRLLLVSLSPIFLLNIIYGKKVVLSVEKLAFLLFFLSLVWEITLVGDLKEFFRAAALVLFPAGLCALISTLTTTSRSLQTYISVVDLLMVVSILVAAWEFWTGNHLPTSRVPELPYYLQHRVTAWYYNTNDFGYFLAVLSPLYVSRFLYGGWREKVLSVVVLGGVGGVFILNLPRAAIGGTVLSAGVCVMVYAVRDRIHSCIHVIRKLTIALLLVVVAVAVLLSFLIETVPFGSRPITIRWNLFRISTDVALTTVTGTGLLGFEDAVMQSALPTEGITDPHFWLTWLLGTVGVVGTILFLWMYGSLLATMLHRSLEDESYVSLGLFGALVSFTVAGIGPSNVFKLEVTWVVFALCLAASQLFLSNRTINK